jgi:hypothetical protein
MTQTPYLAAFFANAHRQLDLLAADCMEQPAEQLQRLQLLLNAGAFLRYEVGSGAGGRCLGAQLVLVDRTGAQACVGKTE